MIDVDLKKDFRDLEMRVLSELRTLVGNSDIKSKHVELNCLKLKNYDDYEEIVLINERLTFLDYDGYQHSIFNASLETLVDIVVSQQ